MLELDPRVRPDVYCVDDNGGVDFRMGSVRLDIDERFVDETDIDRPLCAIGLNMNDLAVFVDYYQGKRVAHEIGYVVTHVHKDRSGVLVPGDLIVAQPQNYLDQALTRRLSVIEPDAFAEFNLEALGNLLAKRKS